LDELGIAKAVFISGCGSLEVAVGALNAVITFLGAEPRIADQGLVQPLAELSIALTDLWNTSPASKRLHPLLMTRRDAKARVRDVSENFLKGAGLSFVDILADRGVQIPEACKLVAAEFGRHGIQYRAKSLQQLRYSVGARRTKNQVLEDVRKQLNAAYLEAPLPAEVHPTDVARRLLVGFVAKYGNLVGMSGRSRGWKSVG
jgi:hypothetical protein